MPRFLQTTWKNKTKSIKMIDLLMKNWKIRVYSLLYFFFMWFARFQILICVPQSIWRKLLVLSWLSGVFNPLRIFNSYAFPTTFLKCRCRAQRSFNRQDRRSKYLVGSVLRKGHLSKKVLLPSELEFDGLFGIPSSVGPALLKMGQVHTCTY